MSVIVNKFYKKLLLISYTFDFNFNVNIDKKIFMMQYLYLSVNVLAFGKLIGDTMFIFVEPVFSAICGVRKIKETDVVLCDLKHRHSYLVKTTSPFIWLVLMFLYDYTVFYVIVQIRDGGHYPDFKVRVLFEFLMHDGFVIPVKSDVEYLN